MSDPSSSLSPPLLVFTDLDGTLLDHDTYSYDPALPMLKKLAERNVPVIPATSKTRVEVELLVGELQQAVTPPLPISPMIVENGAAVYLPEELLPNGQGPGGDLQSASGGKYWVKTWSEPREHWQQLIRRLAPEFPDQFSTFAEASVEAIAAWTGLSAAAAQRASEREFGEPVRWLGTAEAAQEFSNRITSLGARVLQGGRFLHVSGSCDKGQALRWIAQLYTQLYGVKQVATLAAGDSPNDVAMLEAADYAVVVRSPSHLAPDLQRSEVGSERQVLTNNTGPNGWAEGISQLVGPLLL